MALCPKLRALQLEGDSSDGYAIGNKQGASEGTPQSLKEGILCQLGHAHHLSSGAGGKCENLKLSSHQKENCLYHLFRCSATSWAQR